MSVVGWLVGYATTLVVSIACMSAYSHSVEFKLAYSLALGVVLTSLGATAGRLLSE
jgi:hypothetical protein